MLCAVTLTRTSCSHTRAVLAEKCLNQDGVDQSVFSFPGYHGHLVFSTNSPLLHIPLPVLLCPPAGMFWLSSEPALAGRLVQVRPQDRSQVCDG